MATIVAAGVRWTFSMSGAGRSQAVAHRARSGSVRHDIATIVTIDPRTRSRV
jgi:hypothetical protein